MRVSVPLFIHSHKPQGSRVPVYIVRPLLFQGTEFRGANLGKATADCVSRLRKSMNKLCRNGQFGTVVEQTFAPSCHVHRLKLDFHLRSTFRRSAFVVVSFRALDRTIAFLPTRDDMWFEVPKDEGLQIATHRVLNDFLVDREKDQDSIDEWIAELSSEGRSWVSTVDFDIQTNREAKTLKSELAAFLSPSRVADGATELDNVGRCLNVLYPDRLMRSAERDALVGEVATALGHEDRRPVLLVGPRLVGKTALIHEVVYRTRDANQQSFESKGNTWLLSPQRLISGMSYVGQWENRLLAILKHAKKQSLTLYFDDLVGLYRAGVSRDSDLSIAQVMKPWIERREVRLLGEMTPEALRVLREQDRSFADMFHIIRVDEPNHAQSLKMLLSVIRDVERSRRQFAPNVIPVIVDLCRRFSRNAAMPGVAAEMLRGIVSRDTRPVITRQAVLSDFQQRSGLNLAFVDQSRKLERESIVSGLREGIVGQDAAVEAVADRICLSRARLNDPGRPLGSFLFAGPTGVGKTQCARALADYLYGSSEKMVRFDMNEFVTHYSAARLVGTFSSPEGLLTSAVRQQPFSVVLLDEIEKAHPDVFDLLLQVLGEGRLTDALGNTVDFGNTFVIMTSNLGSSEAAGIAGFGEDKPRVGAYLKAVERFFRPEFVNRLDKIIPFAPLDAEQIHAITRRLIEAVSEREGFSRRRCIMHPHPRVVDLIVKRGYVPKWGARGVRREVEQTVLQPIANQLSKATNTTPTIVSLDVRNEQVSARVQPLQDVEPATNTITDIDTTNTPAVVEAARKFLSRAAEVCQENKPQTELVAGSIDSDYYHYLSATELIRELSKLCDSLLAQKSDAGPDIGDTLVTRARTGRTAIWRSKTKGDSRQILSEFAAVDDITEFMDELGKASPLDVEAELPRLVRAIGLLNLLLPDGNDWHDQRVLVIRRTLQTSVYDSAPARYVRAFSDGRGSLGAGVDWSMGIEVESDIPLQARRRGLVEKFNMTPVVSDELAERLDEHECTWKVFDGAGVYALMLREQGTHLFVRGTRMAPYQLIAVPMTSEETIPDVISRILDAHDQSFSRDDGFNDESNPFCIRPVIRIYAENDKTIDLRTGITANMDMLPLMLSALPLPKELLDLQTPAPGHQTES